MQATNEKRLVSADAERWQLWSLRTTEKDPDGIWEMLLSSHYRSFVDLAYESVMEVDTRVDEIYKGNKGRGVYEFFVFDRDEPKADHGVSLYKITDGEHHWCFGKSPQEALAQYERHWEKTSGDPIDEPATIDDVIKLNSTDELTVDVGGDKVTLLTWQWVECFMLWHDGLRPCNLYLFCNKVFGGETPSQELWQQIFSVVNGYFLSTTAH